MDEYANIKAVFFAEALNNSLNKSTLGFKHQLKYAVNNLKNLYKNRVVKTMVVMYENQEEAFDTISDYTEKIGEEFAKTDPTKYGLLLEVLKKFNNDELFEKQKESA